MQFRSIIIALGALVAQSTAHVLQGFTYGSTKPSGGCQGYDDFVELFEQAKSLPGATPGFTAARLYTSIQCGTANTPIEAFKAAIDTNTKILLGLWASAGSDVFESELKTLINAAHDLGRPFTDRVVGISVGSEDLYRNLLAVIGNKEGPGATAGQIMGYIGWLRDWLRPTLLADKPVGHVDTWNAWILPENKGVIDMVDFVGHNSFPYFETAYPNPIEKAADIFWSAVAATESVAQGKAVWITETGWPSTGPRSRDAVPSEANAETYWNTVGCSLFGKRNTFWYTLVDGAKSKKDLSFSVIPALDETPRFDVSCN